MSKFSNLSLIALTVAYVIEWSPPIKILNLSLKLSLINFVIYSCALYISKFWRSISKKFRSSLFLKLSFSKYSFILLGANLEPGLEITPLSKGIKNVFIESIFWEPPLFQLHAYLDQLY